MSYPQMYNERIVHVIVAGGQLVRAYPTPDDANENADKIRSMQPNTKVVVVPLKLFDNQCIDSRNQFNKLRAAW